MIWFYCKRCDGWAKEPTGFQESKHLVRCECGNTMLMHHTGDPADGAITRQVKGEAEENAE